MRMRPRFVGLSAAVVLTLTPVAAASAAPYQGLTRSEVLAVLQSASENKLAGEHLGLDGKIVTVPDGHGGALTAVPAVRRPTADGLGQYILFWHGKTFLGSDRLAKLPYLGEESLQATIAHAGVDAITVRFQRYRPGDPMVAPSLPPQEVTYRWNGSRLVASQTVPLASGNGLAMTLPPSRSGELTRTMVLSVLAQATENGTGEHLRISGKIVTVPDGYGGVLAAVPAGRSPTADGLGQYVLFWDNATFLGSDRLARLPYLGAESVQIGIVSTGPDRVTLRFARYRPNDPMYAPSLPSVDVTYRWNATRLLSSRPVPLASGNGLAMWLLPVTP